MNEILQFDHTDETTFVNRPPSFFLVCFTAILCVVTQRYSPALLNNTKRGGEQTTIFSAHKNIEFRIFLEAEVKQYRWNHVKLTPFSSLDRKSSCWPRMASHCLESRINN